MSNKRVPGFDSLHLHLGNLPNWIRLKTVYTHPHEDNWVTNVNHQGPDFEDTSSFLPCEIDRAIQYINLGCGVQAPKIVILECIFRHFVLCQVIFCNFSVIFLSYFQALLHFYRFFFQVILNFPVVYYSF